MDQRIINREPQLSGACFSGLNPQTLGIDQRSIHVKNNSLDHIGPPSTLAVALLQLYRIWQLVYNVYTILHFRTQIEVLWQVTH